MDATENLLFTLVFIGAIYLLRVVLLKIINQWKINNDLKRKWEVGIKQVLTLILIAGVFVVWAAEIKTFAISIVAVAVALVIATKELILCFIGGLIRASNHPFRLGDLIVVGDHRGEVINITFTTTTLLEVGHKKIGNYYTGRSINIPNSIFLLNPVINESFSKKYLLHTFHFPMNRSDNWSEARDYFYKKCEEVSSPYIEKVKKYFYSLKSTEKPGNIKLKPKVSVVFPDPDRVDLIVRLPVPRDEKGEIEQRIIDSYFSQEKKNPSEDEGN